MYVPFGHSKHCPDVTNDTPENSAQHWKKDNDLLLSDLPPQ